MKEVPDEVYILLGIAGISWRAIIVQDSWYMLIMPPTSQNGFFEGIDRVRNAGYTVLAGTFDAAGYLGGHQIEFYEESHE